MAFRWDPRSDVVTEAFAWPRGLPPAQALWLGAGGALLEGDDGSVVDTDGWRAPPEPDRTTALRLPDGVAVTARWSGHVTLWRPGGAVELLVALDGAWRARVDGRLVAEGA